MTDLLASWIPGLFLLAVLAGAAWGAVGVSAGSPGWGSIQGFLGLFLAGGAIGGYLPRRALREVLELAGIRGSSFWDLPPAYRPGIDLIWAGMDQAVQLALLGAAFRLAQWPRRSALRVAVALGLGSVFCRSLVAVYHHGAAGLEPSELATQLFGAGAAALLLGSLFGVGHKLAAWMTATVALALTVWTAQSLPVSARPLAGVTLLLTADRLLWSWRVGESEGVERLYPLWRAAYEVHRQCRGARRLLKLWSQIRWRERVFRALGSWLLSCVALAVLVLVPLLPGALLAGSEPDPMALIAGGLGGALLSVGSVGLAWAAAGSHARQHPQWAFLADLDRQPQSEDRDWGSYRAAYLCVLLVGVACWLAATG